MRKITVDSYRVTDLSGVNKVRDEQIPFCRVTQWVVVRARWGSFLT